MKFFPPKGVPPMQELNAPASAEPVRERGATLPQRILLLLVCLALGLGASFAGLHFTSSTEWFLAVPICLTIGWFFVADPTACTTNRASINHDRPVGL